VAARPRLGLPRGTRLPTIAGRVPELHALPPGCAFAPRCPRADTGCAQALPVLQALAAGVGAGHAVACRHPHGSPQVPA
jgi:oligopeptide/dipeptide ABC transporter ATP-binding protein